MIDQAQGTRHQAPQSTFLTVAYGDGVGPEIMEAVLFVLKEARVNAFIETIEAGERFYENGVPHGISPDAFKRLDRTGVLLKAPHIMPEHENNRSPQSRLDEAFHVLMHLLPLRSFSPVLPTAYPERDSLLVLGQPACETDEMLLRASAQIAMRHGKPDLIWLSDHPTQSWWSDLAAQFPLCRFEHAPAANDIARYHSHVVVTRGPDPERAATLCSDIAGSAWLPASAHLSPDFALFQPMHGAMQGTVNPNPSGMLRAACLMLLHIGQPELAALIENAWLKTLEDGMHTPDMPLRGGAECGTMAFAQGVAERLGEMPQSARPIQYPALIRAA